MAVNKLQSLNDVQKQKIRTLVAGVYDIQKLRIATGNRIVQSFNIQMGQAPSTKQDDMDKEAQKLISKLRDEYKLITDAYIDRKYCKDKDGNLISYGKSTINKKDGVNKNDDTQVSLTVIEFKKNESIEKVINRMSTEPMGVSNIRSKSDYDLIKSYMDLIDSEETMLSTVEKEVKNHPLWDMFFKDVKGCGPLMAAVCISYFDIDKARHVSSFWKYAGLDTVPVTVDIKDEDGNVIGKKDIREGRGAKHAKFTKMTYIDKDGKEKEKFGLGYNPVLKTKLCGVLADCMIKAGLRTDKDTGVKVALSPYVQCMLDYRNRLDQRHDTKDYTDGHKFNMAKRYMIKQFIRDLWVVWRGAAGYEVSDPYEVEKLGMKPHKYNEAQCEAHMNTMK